MFRLFIFRGFINFVDGLEQRFVFRKSEITRKGLTVRYISTDRGVLTTSCPTISSLAWRAGFSLNSSPMLCFPITTFLGSKDSSKRDAHSKVFPLTYSSKTCVTKDCRSLFWIAASFGSSSCASGSGAEVPLRIVAILMLDFLPGREGRFLPDIVCTKEMTARVAWFEGRKVERMAINVVERNREGYLVLIRGWRIERRLIRVQNFEMFVGSAVSSFSSASSSSSTSNICKASVTFRTTSLGFPSLAIVVRHLSEPGRGRSRCIRSQPMFCVRVSSWRISLKVGRISGERCDSTMVK